MAAGPTISRGDMYGGNEGRQSTVAEASGPVVGGMSPAVWALIIVGALVVVRFIWERSKE